MAESMVPVGTVACPACENTATRYLLRDVNNGRVDCAVSCPCGYGKVNGRALSFPAPWAPPRAARTGIYSRAAHVELMELHSHVALAACLYLLTFLAAPGLVAGVSPLILTLYLFSAIAPDLDLVFGFKWHRCGSHSLLFAAIYALAMVYAFKLIGSGSEALAAAGLLVAMYVVLVVYTKGQLRKSANVLVWVAILAGVVAYEFGGAWGAALTPKVVFLAAFLGCAAHCAGDLISASGASQFRPLWPLKKRLGCRVVWTGQWSERGLYGLMVAFIALSACAAGAHTPGALAGYFGTGNVRLIALLAALVVGAIAAYSSYSPKREWALVK